MLSAIGLGVLLAAQGVPTKLTLYRGASLPGLSTKYWSVHDTVLDVKEPDRNFGGIPFLSGGTGKTVMIEFEDLERAVGLGKRVRSASLILTVTGGRPVLRSVSRVLAPWGEGPIPVLVPWLQTPRPGPPQDPTKSPAWCATWRHRRAGADPIPWQTQGAMGPADAERIAEARAVTDMPDAVRIEGLGPAVQRHLERPHENHGFALSFEEPVEFFSSQGPRGRPALEIELEDAPIKGGPDLAVVLIERQPELDLPVAAPPVRATQDGAEVLLPPKATGDKPKLWPEPGEEVTYVARVKNVGDATAGPFLARWVVRESPGAAVEVTKGLKPGEETTLSFNTRFRATHDDHRTRPIGLAIEPKGEDARAANDFLEIHEGALTVTFLVSDKIAESVEASRAHGATPSLEERLQAHIRALNDVFFPQSRFSFARDGVLERVRIAAIRRGDSAPFSSGSASFGPHPGSERVEAPLASGFNAGNVASSDAVIVLQDAPNPRDVDRALLRQILEGLGLVPLDSPRLDRGASGSWGSADRFPGLLGYGDTRNDCSALPQAWLNYEPWPDPLLDPLEMEATDLLCATDVGALNANLGFRVGRRGEHLYDLPNIAFLRLTDRNRMPLANAQVTAYPSVAGAWDPSQPLFETSTDSNGLALLPRRPIPGWGGGATASGRELKPNPFGLIDRDGKNGAILLKCLRGGVEEWAWLKLWQLVDAHRRNPVGPVFVDLRFNVSDGPIDERTNLSTGRIVTDSAGSLPAQLVAALDGDPTTSVTLPAEAGAWIEIDLGRDRVIGEVRIVPEGARFWKQFDILVYGTGQRPIEAQLWATERDWDWTFANRADRAASGEAAVVYRAAGKRIRYVRIVNRASGPASLAEVVLRPQLPGPGPTPPAQTIPRLSRRLEE